MIDGKDGLIMQRTTLVANTSNILLAAREAASYTVVTKAGYLRDSTMIDGKDVPVMQRPTLVASTSNLVVAAREASIHTS